ncbi:signal peptidase I [Desulforudis sp. 1088]|uniref:signal peptidase I n=1 Tax=unclassified Candidatus Desulforudis TaxID=2635950 RepID=UPI003CE5750A
MRLVFKILGNVLTIICLLLVAGGVFYLVKARLDGGVPQVAGHALYVVLSGSMSPAFDPGSLVAVAPAEPAAVGKGDVITFKDPNDPAKIVTHRVSDVVRDGTKVSFVTKGDANNADDRTPVPAANVLGRVRVTVPYAGFVVDFVKKPAGLVLLIILPALAVIVSELIHLYRLLRQEEEKAEEKAEVEEPVKAGAEAGF